jgi:Divergent InlB B-repeat domain
MAILRTTVWLALVGCYAPDAPDCTLACTANTDCISGKACTTDHLCAGTNITTCGVQATTDGSVPGSDAGTGTMITLTVQLEKDGSVRDSDNDVCNSPTNSPLECTFQVHSGEPLTITAIPDLTKQFDKWSGPPCMGQLAMCHTTPVGNITVNAMFK